VKTKTTPIYPKPRLGRLLTAGHGGDPSARSAVRQDPGPARTAAILDLLEQDVELFPLAMDPPAPVAEAHQLFLERVEQAHELLGTLSRARQAAKKAQSEDVDAATKALREGKAPPKLSRPEAERTIDVSETQATAAEALLLEAHEALLVAMADTWPEWRRTILDTADAAHGRAVTALEKAQAAIGQRRGLYGAVLDLDSQLVEHFPEVKIKILKTTRSGLSAFSAAVGTYARNPRLSPLNVAEGKTTLAEALRVVEAHLRQDIPWRSDWCPPGDPAYEDLMSQPLDPTRPWVRRAVFREIGGACHICGQGKADTLEDVEGRLLPVHSWCVKGKAGR